MSRSMAAAPPPKPVFNPRNLPFFAAIKAGDIEETRAEMNHKITPTPANSVDKDGWTGLMRAAEGGDLAMCLALAERHAQANQVGPQGLTALHVACEHGHVDIIQFLLKNSASVDQPDASGFTPLMHAVRNKHTEAAQELMAHRPNLAAAVRERGGGRGGGERGTEGRRKGREGTAR